MVTRELGRVCCFKFTTAVRDNLQRIMDAWNGKFSPELWKGRWSKTSVLRILIAREIKALDAASVSETEEKVAIVKPKRKRNVKTTPKKKAK